ncbi:hypothetical protein P3S67_015948 [Capsicum chacoense]
MNSIDQEKQMVEVATLSLETISIVVNSHLLMAFYMFSKVGIKPEGVTKQFMYIALTSELNASEIFGN